MTPTVGDLIARGFDPLVAQRIVDGIASGTYVPGGDLLGTVNPDGTIQAPAPCASGYALDDWLCRLAGGRASDATGCGWSNLSDCVAAVPWATVALYGGIGILALIWLGKRL